MAKFLGKQIETEEQKEIHNRLKQISTRLKQLQIDLRKKEIFYYNMEGKYSSKTVYDGPEQGYRGYFYVYEKGMKEKERKERKAFYDENIVPLEKEEKNLWKERKEKENDLCKLLWGFDKETYDCYKAIERNKKEIEETKEMLAYLIAKDNELEEEFNKKTRAT